MRSSRSDGLLSQRRETRSHSPLINPDIGFLCNDGPDHPARTGELPTYLRCCEEDKKLRQTLSCRRRYLWGGCLLIILTYVYLYSSHRPRPACEVAAATQRKLAWLKKTSPRKNMIADWKPEIPKIIHHQWKDKNIPPKFQAWHQAWFDLFPEPEWTHMHWTDEAGRKLIEDHYTFFLPTYDAYDYNIKRVDVVRYFVMHHHGGIHADLDYEPMINFFSHLPQDRVSVVESPFQYYEFSQNSLMSSPKGDPFWLEVFDQLELNKAYNVMEATGPKLLDTVRASSNEPVHILPCENFQRISLGENVAPFLSRLQKEVLGRVYPMKQCGNYHDQTCQFAKHHCSTSYFAEISLWDLLWKK